MVSYRRRRKRRGRLVTLLVLTGCTLGVGWWLLRESELTTSDPQYRQKLLRMGLTRSAEFAVVRKAPFGGPIEIEVKGSRLVLRSDEADALEVEKK